MAVRHQSSVAHPKDWPGYTLGGTGNPMPLAQVDALLHMPNSPIPVVEQSFKPRGGSLTGVGTEGDQELKIPAYKNTYSSFREVWETVAAVRFPMMTISNVCRPRT